MSSHAIQEMKKTLAFELEKIADALPKDSQLDQDSLIAGMIIAARYSDMLKTMGECKRDIKQIEHRSLEEQSELIENLDGIIVRSEKYFTNAVQKLLDIEWRNPEREERAQDHAERLQARVNQGRLAVQMMATRATGGRG